MQKIICIEGIPGSGKSTQIEMLKKHFGKEYVVHEFIRHPIFKEAYEKNKHRIKNLDEFTPEEIRTLAKMALISQKESLKGKENLSFVIIERGVYSLMTYLSRIVGIETIEKICSEEKVIDPSTNIILDCSVETAMERISKRKDLEKGILVKMYKNDYEFIDYMKKKYLSLSNRPDNYLINTEKKPESIFKEILEIITNDIKISQAQTLN